MGNWMSLSNSQDLNIQDDIGWNPLMLAASNGHLDIVRYLCDRGADVDIRDTRGLELQMKVHDDFTLMEKTPTWSFSWLKAPTVTNNTLSKQYSKQALTHSK